MTKPTKISPAAQDIKLVWMTVPWAKELLKKQDGNRRVRWSAVRYFAAEILAGRWKLTTDAAGLREDGRLANGQHRLLAMVEAGKVNPNLSLPMYFCVGITEDEFRVIDTGIKRSAADALMISMTVAADAALIAHILGRDIERRVPVEVVASIVPWWQPISDILLSTHSGNAKGLSNASIRVGAGLRWAVETDEAKKTYILTQYPALLKGDVVSMSRATAALWKRMVESGTGFYGTTPRRIMIAMLAYRSFNPDTRDVVPRIQDRDAALKQMSQVIVNLMPDVQPTKEAPKPRVGEPQGKSSVIRRRARHEKAEAAHAGAA
jgi:hypothetical protein